MEIYIMPSANMMMGQVISLIVIIVVIYLYVLLIKALRIYIKKHS
ncbi:MAG: hypothetical protein U0N77_10150 [Turicibacter sanguinis]|nr:hypothetical protein [Turicibacter sanguinis]MDB8543018.1 hypothetical protein [Turicibacter sanguinis]MDB8545659.1 hypothetical protein [Turicibacter sanguinis]